MKDRLKKKTYVILIIYLYGTFSDRAGIFTQSCVTSKGWIKLGIVDIDRVKQLKSLHLWFA